MWLNTCKTCLYSFSLLSGNHELLPSPSVLLVSPPSIPQLGTILPNSQSSPPVSQPVTSQHAARIVSHLAAGSLPQVRMVSAPSGLASSAGNQQATLVHQTPHQIRMPVSVSAISQVCTHKLNVVSVFTERGYSPWILTVHTAHQ